MLKTISRLLLHSLGALALLLAAPVLANPLEAVRISEGEAGTRVVRLGFGETLHNLPMHFTTRQPDRIVLDFAGVENRLGRGGGKGSGVIRAYSIAQSDERTRVVLDLAAPAAYELRQDGNALLVVVHGETTTTAAAAAATTAAPRYGGERLSLDFHEEDVNALLKVIADFTRLNIVVSDSVKGKISLRLIDVPWDQALDVILRARGLDQRTAGDVIWVAPREELAAREKQDMEARQQAEDFGELVAEIVRLNYMRASEAQQIVLGSSTLSQTTNRAVTCSTTAVGIGGTAQTNTVASGETTNSMISKRGSASFDLKTNALFIYDTRARIEKIRKLLAEIDVPARQVMIEARVVIANDGFSRDLGSRLELTRPGLAGGNLALKDFSAATTNLGLAGTAAQGILGLSIVHASSGVTLGLELSALEADNRGKVLSNPRVVTQNQQPAVILQGQQIPYVTPGGTNEPATTTFQDAMLCLLVDPQILNNDEIILDVEIQKDAPKTVIGADALAIDTKRVKTQVRLKSGETAVLGGIFEQELTDNTAQVPGLGEVPLLGWLFRNSRKSENKTELIIFITPRLLDAQPLS